MKNLPIEKQVCSLEQAKKLAELLGDDAQESLWSWQCITDPVLKTKTWVLVLSKTLRGFMVVALPAYTGDELGVLLPHVIIADCEAHAKAELAIKGLTEGSIKPEDFRYED